MHQQRQWLEPVRVPEQGVDRFQLHEAGHELQLLHQRRAVQAGGAVRAWPLCWQSAAF